MGVGIDDVYDRVDRTARYGLPASDEAASVGAPNRSPAGPTSYSSAGRWEPTRFTSVLPEKGTRRRIHSGASAGEAQPVWPGSTWERFEVQILRRPGSAVVLDAEWALIEPHVPVAATGPLLRRVRDQFNGVVVAVPHRHRPAGLPLAFVLTPGRAADCRQFQAVWEKVRVRGPVGRPRTRPEAVAADKAYSSRANHAYLRRRGITAVVPERADRAANRKRKGSAGGRPVAFDPDRYKRRNHVERCFQRIKTWRGLATRYDKGPESYTAGLHLRGSIMWLKFLTPAA
ncbi:hypothetical protein CG736_06415 [Kitasatospora sp. CB02891]|nr:hypothetical protein CG736_06415 [Kitasatospora sp. CB02891]